MTEGKHAVRLSKEHVLNRYFTDVVVARPESWREDTTDATGMSGPEKFAFWSNIAAAAESGLDFSSRWMYVKT